MSRPASLATMIFGFALISCGLAIALNEGALIAAAFVFSLGTRCAVGAFIDLRLRRHERKHRIAGILAIAILASLTIGIGGAYLSEHFYVPEALLRIDEALVAWLSMGSVIYLVVHAIRRALRT
jgi:hypothetical protein